MAETGLRRLELFSVPQLVNRWRIGEPLHGTEHVAPPGLYRL
jgi:hypothetical protein